MRRAIARKRDGDELEPSLWHAIVADYCADVRDEAPMAALLMACTIRGLSAAETRALTEAFVASGETLHAPDPRTVDKHSSGGVADTASLAVVPLVAACGVPVAKLSGRALGHTGGTLDKLEALPGVRTALEPAEFFAIVDRVGCAIAAQSARLVPADKRAYALRDRTATIASPGLIAASIVSKKIAGGAHAIVYDVKCGSGAFLHEPAQAHGLARELVDLTRALGRRAHAVVSDMNEPLGRAIGTGLELREARDLLRGARDEGRLRELVVYLGIAMLALAEPGTADVARDRERLTRALATGAAFERFEAMLVAQGGSARDLAALDAHATQAAVRADRSGYVVAIDAVALGERARELTTSCGPTAGLVVRACVGDRVAAGDDLATAYGDASVAPTLVRCFTIEDAAPERRALYAETDVPSMREPSTRAASAAIDSPRSILDTR
ncbi:MAG: pyrimidine-nucleoside phosphorylase [Vulcanimicrobiaceae bacterium]